jgi:hypothetical protein
MSWSSTHGAIGGAIVLITPDPVLGLGLAFVSHFVMDYIGETGYKDLKEAAFIEACLLGIYIASATLGDFWLLMGGWVMANLPDLIDKPRRLIWKKKEWFSCHDGVGLFQWFGIKLGYPVLVRLTYWQTMLWNVGTTVLFMLTMIFYGR